MSSREKMLAAIKASQPEFNSLPDLGFTDKLQVPGNRTVLLEQFTSVLTGIGGKVIRISALKEVLDFVKSTTVSPQRVISSFADFSEASEFLDEKVIDPHSLADIELAIVRAQYGVAENGAVWIKDDLEIQRVLPFICQHLAVVLNTRHIVANMHQAYEKIGREEYGYGTFIAGPSKTADIEQSLVLGAHGARSMTIFLLDL